MIKLKRRIGSAVLAVMMLLSLMPLTALAAGDIVAKIGNQEYDSLQAAVNAAQVNTATTITLVDNITLAEPVTISTNQKITINGDGKTISYDASSCKVVFSAPSGAEVEGIPSGVTLNINNVTFKNTNASVASSGYAVLVGGNSLSTAVSLDGCSFDNLYTAVYVNQQRDKDAAPSLSITDCTYSNTTYGYSIDETTVGAYKDAVQVTFPADSNKGVATEKETWKNIAYINDKVVAQGTGALLTAIEKANPGDTISLAGGEYDVTVTRQNEPTYGSGAIIDKDNITIEAANPADKPVIYGFSNKFSAGVGDGGINGQDTIYVSGKNVTLENLVIMPLGGIGENANTWQKTVEVVAGAEGFTMTGCETRPNDKIYNGNGETNSMSSAAGNIHVSTNDAAISGNSFGEGTTISAGWIGSTAAEGTYSVNVSGNYWGEGVTAADIAGKIDGNVIVDTYYTDAEMTTPETIGGTPVATAEQLKNAIANAKDGDTIVLANDIPDAKGISVSSGKNFTIDFAGHTYTLTGPGAGSTNTETNGFQLLKDSTITMKNGTIRIAENANNVKRIIQNYANLTLIDMQFYAKNQVDGEDYSLSFNNGKIKFKGNTSIFTTSDDAIAFDVCQFSSYPSVNVVFDTDYTGTINGRILYDSPKAETHKLTIKGDGTFGRIDFTNSSGNAAKEAIDIYSGTFCESVSEYVVDTLKYELRGANGTFTYYATEEAALAAAQPGDVVVAIGDISQTEYTVTVKNGDQIVAQGTVIANGKYILPAAPSRAGYSFRGWYGNGHLYAAGEAVQITKDTTFVAQWSDNTPYYTITVKDAANGTVTCYAKSAAKGADVTLNVKADVGYQLDKLTVTDASGNVIDVEKVNNTTYTFVMPGSKVTVEAVFAPTTVEPSGLPFTDVSTSDWFYSAVKFVYENGLMDGVGNNLFAPNATLNRAMAVTILYRLEGAPAVTTDAGFNDVAAGTWYTDAVNWAAANNIVNGVEGNNFDPTGSLTREQMATVLYRYAQYKGADVSAAGDISGFADSANVSSWAADAVKWAVGSGLVNGVEGNALAPQGTSTRAQAATVLMRFVG